MAHLSQQARIERRDEIMRLVKLGISHKAIALRFGIGTSTVGDEVRRYGNGLGRKNGPNRPWTTAEHQALLGYVAEGREAGAIAKLMGRSVCGLRERAASLGCPFPAMGGVVAPDRLPHDVAAINYARIEARLEAGLRAPANNVTSTPRARSYDMSGLDLAQRPTGRELNVW